MSDNIKILLADDIAATRINICKLLEFYPEMMVVGQAGTAEEAIQTAKQVQPDIILMDINMPGMDGITATQILTHEVPDAGIIIMSVQNEQEYLRKAMIAGAKNYLTKPFTADELLQAVKQVHDNELKRRQRGAADANKLTEGRVITVFSTKGGIGKTTIATNLAVALAEKTKERVCILDADLQFGDVALFLNVIPQATVADLIQDIDHLDKTLLESYLSSYRENLKILPAPLRPEQAEIITGAHLTAILKTLRTMFEYIIVDTAPAFNDTMLAVLDAADDILVVAAMDLPTVKNVKLCLEIMDSLNYSSDKVKMVLNRAGSEGGMEVCEVEKSLRRDFTAKLPSDGKTVLTAVNKGIPFVISHPETIVAESIFDLARAVSDAQWNAVEKPKGIVNKFKSLFS